MPQKLWIGLVLLAADLPQPPPLPPPPIARIQGGLIQGAWADAQHEVRVFRGIPYAAPPVGKLRWRFPKPPSSWQGVKLCIRFGPSCPQKQHRGLYASAAGAQSEDCLDLNVWCPAQKRPAALPVMVWIHGGGFIQGSGSKHWYDGTALARQGVVVVTINYRLGRFGFLAHPLLAQEAKAAGEPAVSGNYGLLDQMAALKWVRRNIQAFGGDPHNVTVFGESAGAVSVSCLMVAPPAKGLFERAIAESGGPRGVALAPRNKQGLWLFKKLGVAGARQPLEAARKKSWQEVLQAARPQFASLDPRRKYGPSVDGWLLPEDPVELWNSGRQHDLPFMTGSNADDGGVFSSALPIKTRLGYRLALRRLFGRHAPEVFRLFPAKDRAAVRPTLRHLLTVAFFARSTRSMARAMGKRSSKGWLYRFSRVPPGAAQRGRGAAHGLEILYIFGTAPPASGFGPADRALSHTMQRYWIQFAKKGNPNVAGLPPWPPYNARQDLHLELADPIWVAPQEERAALKLLERIPRRHP